MTFRESLCEHLRRTEQCDLFRQEFLAAEICKGLTLQDILDAPKDVLNQLSSLRGMGEVSRARLRQVLAREFSESCPVEWEDAKDAVEQGATPETDRARQFADFITAWKVESDIVQITGRYYPVSAVKTKDVYRKLAAGETFVYVCDTLPELIKTPAVLKAEEIQDKNRKNIQASLMQQSERYKEATPRGLVVLSARIMDDLLNGLGIYHNLTEAERTEQITALRDGIKTRPEQDVFIADLFRLGLSPGYVCGKGPLLQYNLGGFLELAAPDLVQIFRDKAKMAKTTGLSVDDWLKKHAGHPVVAALARL